jgi:hypothetical protein
VNCSRSASISLSVSGAQACRVKSVTSIEIGAAVVCTSRPSGSAIVAPRTSMPEPASSRAQARTKLLR